MAKEKAKTKKISSPPSSKKHSFSKEMKEKTEGVAQEVAVGKKEGGGEEVKGTPPKLKEKKEELKQRIRLKLKSYDHKVLDQSASQIIETVKRTAARFVGPIPLPTERSLFSVLRSTFIHKTAQEQFSLRVHKRLIDILDPNQKTIDALMNLNLPAGVDIEIKM